MATTQHHPYDPRPKGLRTRPSYHHLGENTHKPEVCGNKHTSAIDFLERAADLMKERGKEYDSPEGERSMESTVRAFNAITGRDLSEAEGWLMMLLVKMVRQSAKKGFHRDSAEDAVAYSALMAESLARKWE